MPAAPAALLDTLPVLPSTRLARLFERHLVHAKAPFQGQPFILEPWQRDEVVAPIFDTLKLRGSDLIRQYDEALIGVAKKNGKTHLAAGLGVGGLVADGHYRRDPNGWLWIPEYGAEVYNVAGSRDQAKVLFNIGAGFVRRDPLLRAMTKPYRDAIEVPETESVWRVLAAESALAHGPNPSIAIIDEAWVLPNPDLYDAFASAGAARLQPLVITITTSGWKEETIARKLYDRGRRGRSRSFYFRWFEAPPKTRIDDPKALRAANPSKWVTIAYLRKELQRSRELGLESQFRRWHRNEWTGAKEQAIPLDLWDSCSARPRIPKGSDVMVGVDAAPKRDSTGIGLVHRDGKGVHNARATIMRADPDTGYLDFDALEEHLRELTRVYNVQRILVDPYFMVRSMLLLADEGLPIEEFSQGDARMVPASMNLYELLVHQRIRHGGDRALRAQVQVAGKRMSERGWRLAKRVSSGNIDGLIALTMPCYELERGIEEPAPKPTPRLYVDDDEEEDEET